jgi:DNA-binding GntR family transcriptional regulator
MAILNGQLAGGTRLVQSELAKQLDVSTTPVREALRDLASEGLILIDPHRGGVVNELDDAEVDEVYQIRLRLEPYALELAMDQVTEEGLSRAADMHEAMSAAPDSAAWVQLNREFHMALYDMANRPRLVALIKSLQDASVMAVSAKLQRIPNLRRTANAEHGELLEAIHNQDRDRAAAVIRDHLSQPQRV